MTENELVKNVGTIAKAGTKTFKEAYRSLYPKGLYTKYAIITTLYYNKEFFLLELISNASDALNKTRYESITDPAPPNFHIKLSSDKTNSTNTIEDSDIGMTKNELAKHVGTIAKSGTKAFMEAMTRKSEKLQEALRSFCTSTASPSSAHISATTATQR